MSRAPNKTETESMRCSPDLSLALRLSAERLGMTVSALMKTLCQRHVNAQRRLQGLSPHDVLVRADRVHGHIHEAYDDGVMDLPENWQAQDLIIELELSLKEVRSKQEAA